MSKLKVIAIVGPTASGKSRLGAYLAQKLKGEIISADSRQIYKGMKVTSRAEAAHLVGVADPRRMYSSGRYVQEATKIITAISKRNKIPIVVGGAGFYIDPLLRGWSIPAVTPNKKLRATLAKKTAPQLFAMIQKLDTASAARIDRHNPARLVRAIEIAKALGTVPAFELNPPYKTLWLGRAPEETGHSTVIKKGVEERLRRGMVAEVKKLRAALPRKRFAALGFEFSLVADYLDKKLSRQELVEKIVQGEQHYTKRQYRWFKRNTDINWVSGKAEALQLAKQFMRTHEDSNLD